MPRQPRDGAPVDEAEDLRRAIRPTQLDDVGRPTSAPFRTQDMSVDVASLAPLEETRWRFPASYIAVVLCRSFVEEGYNPLHRPQEENISHAVVPGRLTKGTARKIARNAVKDLHPPAQAA